jgi:hypothetical protein
MKSYVYVLMRRGREYDRTSIDEKNIKFARYLFYEDFKIKKMVGDKIVLLKVEEG